MHKHEQIRGIRGKFEIKSSEMAKNASKTVNSNVNLLIITATLNNEFQPGAHV